MVELQVAVQYRITKAEDYLFRVRDPKATLGEVSESAIREVVGRNDQQAILEVGPHQDRRRHARHHAAHARPVRRRHRSAQREHHRRAGARGRAAGAARFGQGEGGPRAHDQGSAGLRERHHARWRRATRRAPCRKPRPTSRRSCRMADRRRLALHPAADGLREGARTSRASACTSKPSRACSAARARSSSTRRAATATCSIYRSTSSLDRARDGRRHGHACVRRSRVDAGSRHPADSRQQGGTLMGSRIISESWSSSLALILLITSSTFVVR